MKPKSLIRSVFYRYPAFALVVICAAVPLTVGLTIGPVLEDFYRRPHYTGVGLILLATIVLITYLNRSNLRSSALQIPERIANIDPNWVFVLIAVAVRYGFLQLLPPDFPGFEEMQQGKIANDIVVLDSHLSFHFLFSNALSAIGFAYLGSELAHLRWAYEVAGSLSILFMAICLRRLGVGWTATLVVIFIMASLRWAVLIGGLAEESFGPSVLMALIILLLVTSDTSKSSRYFWAGLCGVGAGMMMYEYSSFVFFAPLPAIYWLVRTRTDSRATERRASMIKGIWFVSAYAVVAAPLISQFVFEPELTHLGDGIFRHNLYDSRFEDGLTAQLQESGQDLTGYLSFIFGLTSDLSSALFRPTGDSVVPLVIGLVFFVGFIDALRKPKEVYPFFLAGCVIGFLVITSFGTNRYYEARLTPLLPILVLLTGLTLQRVVTYLSTQRWQPLVNVNVIATVAVGMIIWINFTDAVQMSKDEASLIQYSNNNYTVCKSIAEQPYTFDKVITVANVRCGFSDEIWLYADRQFEPFNQPELPLPEEINPGTLVLIGNNHGLTVDMATRARELARVTGNADTMQESKTLLGRTATISFCHLCGTQTKP